MTKMKKVICKRLSIKEIIILIGFLGLIICGLAFGLKDADYSTLKDDSVDDTESLEENSGWIHFSPEETIELCNYKELSVTIDVPEKVTDDDMASYVNQVLKNYPTYELLEQNIVKKNDCVFIDLSGVLEGEEQPCVESKEEVVVLGESVLLKEIQDALIGKKVGESFQVKYTYPDNFADVTYCGKEITFSITVKGIYLRKYVTYDLLDDEYAKNVLGCRSVDEFVSQIKTEMYGIITEYEEEAIKDAVVNKILSTSSFEIPKKFYEQKFEQDKQLFINYYCSGDETLYEEQLYNYTGLSISEYKKEVYEDFKNLVNYEEAAVLIAERENISAEGYDAYVEQQMENYNCSSLEKLYEMLTTDFESGEEYMKKQYYMYVATEYLTENSLINRTEDASVSSLVFETE